VPRSAELIEGRAARNGSDLGMIARKVCAADDH
jgi:hypothetical protein